VTRGNLNNHIGVPLTLLTMTAAHCTASLRWGASNLGEIAHLAKLAAPTIGLVTNAGAAHLEGLVVGRRSQGKGELFLALPGRHGIINADDNYADYWRATAASTIYSLVWTAADFSASKVLAHHDANGFQTRFELITPWRVCGEPAISGHSQLAQCPGAAAAAMPLAPRWRRFKPG
jgi:UDP-N-acetylmuramoyl-tripeptide--D-alanyl-D-alanine ligase